MAISPEDVITTEDFPDAQDGYEQEPTEEPAEEKVNVLKILELVQSPNIALDLEDELLATIGARVKDEYEIDETSRSEWKKRTDDAMKLAMQVAEEKSYPWPKAANVKYPLITTAAIQFNARAYPAIVDGQKVVKGNVVGYDPEGQKKQKADRVARHMSWQLTEQMTEWEEDTDKLTLILPIVGCTFRKSYFDHILGRNCSDLVTADNLVVNYQTKSLSRAPRITQIFELYPYEITERMRTKVYKECDLGIAQDGDGDDDAPHTFLEQHRRWDLDEDGYPEPYVITIHKETTKVVRIVACFDVEDVELTADNRVARVKPTEYFTKYGFIPSPDGGFYDIGFGILLGPIGEAINTALNLMLDAGHIQTVGGGFIGKGLRLKGGPVRLKPGEYQFVDANGPTIRDNIVPLTFPGPSAVLFQLLGLLIEAARDISATKDILTGEQNQSNVPATTTLALIEQGLKVFSAIYKRVHRSLKQELKKLFTLNGRYMQPEEYFQVLDTQEKAFQTDYNGKDLDVVPVSDPTVVTEAQRMGRAQALMPFAQDPDFDGKEIKKRFLEAIGTENIEQLWAKQPPSPPPDVVAKFAEIENKRLELENKMRETEAKIDNLDANSILALAKAEAAEVGSQLGVYKTQLDNLHRIVEGMANGTIQRGGVEGVEGQPGDEGLPPVLDGQPGAGEGEISGGGVLPPESGGGLPEDLGSGNSVPTV